MLLEVTVACEVRFIHLFEPPRLDQMDLRPISELNHHHLGDWMDLEPLDSIESVNWPVSHIQYNLSNPITAGLEQDFEAYQAITKA